MESQPQNPEFRINPEIFHPRSMHSTKRSEQKWKPNNLNFWKDKSPTNLVGSLYFQSIKLFRSHDPIILYERTLTLKQVDLLGNIMYS